MGIRSARRMLLAIVMLSLAVFVPRPSETAIAAAEPLQLVAAADAWLNKARPTSNYGSAPALRARKGASHSVLRFRIDAWRGQAIGTLELRLGGIAGDASTLRVQRTTGGWQESTVNWSTRPSAVASAGATSVSATDVKVDLEPLFPEGIIDRDVLNLRVLNSSELEARFGSRESSAKPTVSLVPATQASSLGIDPVADTFASSGSPSRNYGSAAWLKVASGTARESYLKFDVSAWRGKSVARVELELHVGDSAGAGIRFLRITNRWRQGSLTWDNRPTGGTQVASVSSYVPPGTLTVDVTAAFPDKVVDRDKLSLRILTSSSNGFAFSSREGSAAPRLTIMRGSARVAPSPSPSLSPSPTPKPSASASASPSPSPTPKPSASASASPSPSPTPKPSASASASPSPSPSASPSASPSPSPSASPSPTPEPVYQLSGGGDSHGVGMSQRGARARAAAGQKYDEILAHYYRNTTLGQVADGQLIRVLLGSGFQPSADLPARVIARDTCVLAGLEPCSAGWTSALFPGQVFAADSYAELVEVASLSWEARVYSPLGELLASAPVSDLLLMEPLDGNMLFEIRHRQTLKKYYLYRGQMRMRLTSNGIQTVNILPIDVYLRGVVPLEMPASWPVEALRSQSVAARGYAMFAVKTTGTFDVYPDSRSQVYGGVVAELTRTDMAIADTAGVVVLDDRGRIAETVFHATSGGHTENNEYHWTSSSGKPGTPVSYMRGVPDVDEQGNNYEAGAPMYKWTAGDVTLSELSRMMATDSRTDVGSLSGLPQFERGVSGRVYRVTLVGSGGTKTVSGSIFRAVYNKHTTEGLLYSNLFYFTEVAP